MTLTTPPLSCIYITVFFIEFCAFLQESGLAPTVFTKLDMERKSTEKMIQKKLASIDGKFPYIILIFKSLMPKKGNLL